LSTAHKKVFEDEAALPLLKRTAAFPTGQLFVRCRRLDLDAHAPVLGAAVGHWNGVASATAMKGAFNQPLDSVVQRRQSGKSGQ
jgi:hypothetical protein